MLPSPAPLSTTLAASKYGQWRRRAGLMPGAAERNAAHEFRKASFASHIECLWIGPDERKNCSSRILVGAEIAPSRSDRCFGSHMRWKQRKPRGAFSQPGKNCSTLTRLMTKRFVGLWNTKPPLGVFTQKIWSALCAALHKADPWAVTGSIEATTAF